MHKVLVTTAVVALLASPLAALADGNSNGNPDQLQNFYVAGNLGQTQYRTDISHDNSVFQNVRFGWRWNDYIGPEVGYVYLGRRKNVVSGNNAHSETSVNSRAITLGVNGKYNFYRNWFVTGHAGYLRSQRRDTVDHYVLGTTNKQTSWNNGWYGGVGVGYDVTRNVSVGLNYDNYHLQYGHQGSFHDKVNVAAFSGSVEYRF